MQQATISEMVRKRDRAIIMTGIIGIAALAWVYMLYLSWNMTFMNDMTSANSIEGMGSMNSMESMQMEMPSMEMAQIRSWEVADFILTFIMWAVMMTAMMVPTATPMLLLFANVQRRRKEQQRPYVPTGVFLLGYLAVWYGFAAVASLAQGVLHSSALLSPMMVSTSPILGGVLLVAAGVFQWTSLKSVCLSHCRSPIGFLMTEWRIGIKGAFAMGLRHGAFCLGCCWVLMTLLFVLGVMNLLWIAALAIFVLLEKVAPRGQWIGRFTGLLLIGWGIWMIVRVSS